MGNNGSSTLSTSVIIVEEKKLNKISENVTIKFPEKKINVVTYKKPFKKPVTTKKPVHRENVEELDVVEDYADLIKAKREEMNMTQDELAKKIFERKNVLSNIERGELLPDIATARKLENVKEGSVIATYYSLGNPIYVELIINRSLSKEINKFFANTDKKSAIISIERISKSKYRITPTIVILNRQRGALQK